jgi:fructokinase
MRKQTTMTNTGVEGPGGTRRPLIIGEALFDVYPDGTEVLGGAPFNVAWHLQPLGAQPQLVTRVGNDRRGATISQRMQGWGLDVGGVQTDPTHPTGRVSVVLGEAGPEFDIVADQAYDFLDATVDVTELVGGPPALIYHGSLITRHEKSAAAVHAYRSRTAAPVFLDVNLRAPWWSKESVAHSLLGARWAKLNSDELRQLSELSSDVTGNDLLEAAKHFRSDHALEAVVLTRGETGAAVVLEESIIEARPKAVISGGDTVGAGDAFSAACIAGILCGWPWRTTLDRAMDLAAVVCSLRGAICNDRNLYHRLLGDWTES